MMRSLIMMGVVIESFCNDLDADHWTVQSTEKKGAGGEGTDLVRIWCGFGATNCIPAVR